MTRKPVGPSRTPTPNMGELGVDAGVVLLFAVRCVCRATKRHKNSSGASPGLSCERCWEVEHSVLRPLTPALVPVATTPGPNLLGLSVQGGRNTTTRRNLLQHGAGLPAHTKASTQVGSNTLSLACLRRRKRNRAKHPPTPLRKGPRPCSQRTHGANLLQGGKASRPPETSPLPPGVEARGGSVSDDCASPANFPSAPPLPQNCSPSMCTTVS